MAKVTIAFCVSGTIRATGPMLLRRVFRFGLAYVYFLLFFSLVPNFAGKIEVDAFSQKHIFLITPKRSQDSNQVACSSHNVIGEKSKRKRKVVKRKSAALFPLTSYSNLPHIILSASFLTFNKILSFRLFLRERKIVRKITFPSPLPLICPPKIWLRIL